MREGSAPAIAAVVLLTTAVLSARVAQTRPEPRSGHAFRSGVELVGLAVTVERGDGTFLTGLDRDDFKVFDDGVARDIAFFEAGESPIDLVVMIDASASMTSRLPMAKRAAAHMVGSLGSDDRVALMTIGRKSGSFVPLTHDRRAVQQAIGALRPGGNTAFHDALYVALRAFPAPDHPNDVRRRAVVVLTDGADTTSLMSFDDLLAVARESGVLVYPISLAYVKAHMTIDAENAAAYELRALARESGAKAHFPRELADLEGVYEAIALEIAQQYSLAFVPAPHTGTSRLRRLHVVVDAPDVSVRARTGYTAGS